MKTFFSLFTLMLIILTSNSSAFASICEDVFSSASFSSPNSTNKNQISDSTLRVSEDENSIEELRIKTILTNPLAKDYTLSSLKLMGFSEADAENYWNKFLAGFLIVKALNMPLSTYKNEPYNLYDFYGNVVGQHGKKPLNLHVVHGLSAVVEVITQSINARGGKIDEDFFRNSSAEASPGESAQIDLRIGDTEYVKTMISYGNRIYSGFYFQFYKQMKLDKVELKENELYVRIYWEENDSYQDLRIRKKGDGATVRITNWKKGDLLSSIFRTVGNFETDQIKYQDKPLKTSETENHFLENIIVGLFLGPILMLP